MLSQKLIIGHVSDDVKSGGTVLIQLDIDISGRVKIIYLIFSTALAIKARVSGIKCASPSITPAA